MSLRRVPPLPLALAFVAAALIAATWTSRRAVLETFEAVRDGEALATYQSVRADLAELTEPPTSEQLAAIVADRQHEGVRYIALVEGRRLVADSGTSVGVSPPRRAERAGIQLQEVGGRTRIEAALFRRVWGGGNRPWRLVLEVEPNQAKELRTAATRTLAVGTVAALVLLAIAGWLVRSELRRRAREQQRERERRLASLGEMSAVLAHEIRNPLASLKGNAQLLAASLPAGDKPRAKAERVVEEAVRLERLTHDLLAFVRTGELARSDTTPVDVVRGAVAAVAGDIEIDAAAAPESWSLDGQRMHQAIVNLLENAVAAGPPVRVRVATENRKLVLEVCDRGPGVPREDRDKVFEPFFTGKTRGTGLGLAIVRRVVELHGGSIAVDDAPGGGARFRIEIPEA